MAETRFPYKSYRPGQRESAELIASEIRRGSTIAFQAPTGFGKTITILYAISLAGLEKTIYTVRTRNELTPPFREAVRIGLKPCFLYSKKNMCPLLGDPKSVSVEDFWENCRELRSKDLCPFYKKLREKSADDILSILWSGVESPFRIVDKLAEEGFCPFYSLKTVSEYSDILILTYPYIFNPYIRRASIEEEELSESVLVVDEAHSLLAVIDMIEQRISQRKLLFAIREIERYAPEAVDLRERLEKLLVFLESLLPGRGYKLVPKKEIMNILGDPDVWVDLAYEIRSKKILAATTPTQQIRTRVHVLSIAYFALTSSLDSYDVFIIEHKGLRSFVAKPIDLSIIVEEPFSYPKSVVLMSGTLPDKEYLQDVFGIEDEILYLDVEEKFGPVFPPENTTTLLLTFVTSKFTRRTREMYGRIAQVIDQARTRIRKTILVVYPSYEFMQEILKRITLGNHDIVETEDTRISSVEDHVLRYGDATIHAVAGGKLCEGIEILDPKTSESMIRGVIVVGVPYPQPDDYINRVYRRLAAKIGLERAWEHLFMDTAAMRVRQALGRAIRSERDRAVFVLADNRFLDSRLKAKLRVRIDKVVTSFEEYVRSLILISDFLD